MTTLDVRHRVRLHTILKIDFCVMYAQSTMGRIDLLEDMVDLANEATAAAIRKAMA